LASLSGCVDLFNRAAEAEPQAKRKTDAHKTAFVG
jgi:hypothetical protein